MLLAKGTTVAVADGEKLRLYRNSGGDTDVTLVSLPHDAVGSQVGTSGGRQSSEGNPDRTQVAEDGFSAGVVQYLNKQVLNGGIDGLVIVAAPRALGEMRKHYHKALVAKLQGEIAKELTRHSISDIESAVAAAGSEPTA
jgi:protein required for attachment to host cells